MSHCSRGVREVQVERVEPARAIPPAVVINCGLPQAQPLVTTPTGISPTVTPTVAPAFFPGVTPALTPQQQVALTCLAGALGVPVVQIQALAASLGVDPIQLAAALVSGVPTGVTGFGPGLTAPVATAFPGITSPFVTPGFL